MTFKNKITIGFGAGLAVLILVAILSFRSVTTNDQDRRWVTHSHIVRERIDSVLIDLLEAETGERGFILTGDPAYLEPYETARKNAQKDLKELRRLTADNPTQQHTLDQLDPLFTNMLSMFELRIEQRQQSDLAVVADAVRSGAFKQHLDQINDLIVQMGNEEGRLLTTRLAASRSASRMNRIVIVSGESVAFVFLLLAGILAASEIAQRRRSEEEVRRLNADLEKRVAERTAELAERAKDLARSNSELEQFAYVASHDLQEPLRMVASFTQLLAKRYNDKLDNDGRDFIHYAVDGATRMQTLISDLLTYSRVGTRAKPMEPTDTNMVFSRVLETIRFSVDQSGASISHDHLPVVMADAQQLGQLFQNLLINALKFCGERTPTINVSVERIGSDWKFSFHDNGIGIAQEHAERIFVIFQRLHTKAEYPGNGMGLAICKKIVERHGGRIWVEPSPGGGTTFCLTIPFSPVETIEEGDQNELSVASAAR